MLPPPNIDQMQLTRVSEVTAQMGFICMAARDLSIVGHGTMQGQDKLTFQGTQACSRSPALLPESVSYRCFSCRVRRSLVFPFWCGSTSPQLARMKCMSRHISRVRPRKEMLVTLPLVFGAVFLAGWMGSCSHATLKARMMNVWGILAYCSCTGKRRQLLGAFANANP